MNHPDRPIAQLPTGYAFKTSLDLSRNKLALVGVNVLGLVLLFVFGYLLLLAMMALRPQSSLAGTITSGVSGAGEVVFYVIGVIVVMAAVIILHEAVHGLFFWLFTREKPLFGFKGMYAYAAAPRWYIPRLQYTTIGLAPLIFLTMLGLVLTPILPDWLLLPVFAFMLLNASGAAGDILVVAWLLMRKRGVLARDSGDAVSLYEPAA